MSTPSMAGIPAGAYDAFPGAAAEPETPVQTTIDGFAFGLSQRSSAAA